MTETDNKTVHQNNKGIASTKYSGSSEADRIKQLKELLDDGILTEKEYNEKKRLILNSDQIEYQTVTKISNEQQISEKKKPILKKTVVIILLAIVLLLGLVFLFDAFTISYSEAKIASDEAAAKYREAVNKALEIESELEEVNERIDQIEYNDDLSLDATDYFDLQDLEKKQTLLERDLATYQKLSSIYQKDAAEKASLAMELGGSLKFKLKKK